ncbi:hypothetical protein [Nocardia asiatica]|uniref:hypothetical protein n=1 Tax=Nocardia asiatica TaxID=209252 RepID=UPI0024547717|nr:hypothetical protein [Nocardia asiatica]
MFLLRRNLPLAYQGYYDGFQRLPESPVKQPWGMWGTMSSNASLDASHQLLLPSAPAGEAGGVSFEFQPFTPCYGLEYEVQWPVFGLGDQFLQLFIMPNWAIVGPNFTNTLGVRLMHQPVGTGDTVRIQQWANLNSLSSDVATASSPVPLDGSVPLHLKVWVEDDSYVVVWVNDTIACAGLLSTAYRTGARRRGMNLMQFSTTTARYQWADVYDRKPSCPGDEHWSPTFSDDFNRANGAVGNGWTQSGTDAAIVSNSWATTGTTDGSRAITRDSGITSGRQRITAIVGGAIGPNNTADSSIYLRMNSAGTQAIACNVYGNQIVLALMGGTLTSPTFTNFATTGLTVSSGDKITFSVWDDWAWVEVNDSRKAYGVNISAYTATSNPNMGLRVCRKSSNNSLSWDSVNFYSGI